MEIGELWGNQTQRGSELSVWFWWAPGAWESLNFFCNSQSDIFLISTYFC